MEEIAEIDNFEKKLKVNQGDIFESSSSEEEQVEFKEHSHYSNEHIKLQQKVQMLIQEVVDKEKELEALRETLYYSKPDSEEAEGDFRDKKLVELAKKNRALQVSLETEKNKAARAMEEVNLLRQQLDKKNSTKGWQHTTPSEKPSTDWKQKFHQMEKQFQDMKLKHHSAKSDLKKATRIIQREVGDFESLDQLAKIETWKGRAQQIEKLRSKINDLQRQLTNKPKEETKTPTGSADSRRKEILALQDQLTKTREESEAWKKKAQGASSRKIALEKELKETKETSKKHLRTLLDKTETDDKLISELKEELDRVRQAKGLPRVDTQTAEKEITELKWQVANLHETLAKYEEELREKTEVINLYKNFPNSNGKEIEHEEEYLRRIKELEEQVRKSETNPKSASEEARIIKDLSSQNARLRSKIHQLEEELSKAFRSHS
mmetsp:Transcript_7459/g.10990  ORF Transcript_7459/g.10990 Transcript_7459/m.10990 type:complete len:436 (+) Transcript_7459:21-1328(+)